MGLLDEPREENTSQTTLLMAQTSVPRGWDGCQLSAAPLLQLSRHCLPYNDLLTHNIAFFFFADLDRQSGSQSNGRSVLPVQPWRGRP